MQCYIPKCLQNREAESWTPEGEARTNHQSKGCVLKHLNSYQILKKKQNSPGKIFLEEKGDFLGQAPLASNWALLCFRLLVYMSPK